ncbi:hypothetical protein CPC08DRAFT_22884 [Agrocybe pediades]|nr:hypothetical protein CPC08DRAFT_22884 [Agrocybe pediades]
MASAVFSEPPASRLSISLEGSAASASPFPSPSSSFLPPPTPGAHEFAVKPAPSSASRVNKKPGSLHPPSVEVAPPETDSITSDMSSNSAHVIKPPGSSQPPVQVQKDTTTTTTLPNPPASPALISPMTPTPSTFQRQSHLRPKLSMEYLEPPQSPAYQSNSSTSTPTKTAVPLPPADEQVKAESPPLSKIVIPDVPMDDSVSGPNGNNNNNAPSSPAFSTSSNSRSKSSAFDGSLLSNRPAPPSPAGSLSRRISTSSSASRAKSSRRSSLSRTNSLKRSSSKRDSAVASARDSPVINPHRVSIGSQLSQSFAPSPLPSPRVASFEMVPLPPSQGDAAAAAAAAASTSSVAGESTTTTEDVPKQKKVPKDYIKVRDFGFPASDERHIGVGVDVPKPNKVTRLIRRLGGRTLSTSSVESSDGDGEEEEEEELVDTDEWVNNNLFGGRNGFGWGRIASWNVGAAARSGAGGGGMTAADVMESEKTHYPSRVELDANFLVGGGDSEGDEEEYEDDEDYDYEDDEEEEDGYADEEEEEILHPGLYRAMYAFEPEGTAEMRLEEDQVVRVVGRGGGVGWAVVVDESWKSESSTTTTTTAGTTTQPRHALVPESYLTPVKLDYEDEGRTPASAASAAAAELVAA